MSLSTPRPSSPATPWGRVPGVRQPGARAGARPAPVAVEHCRVLWVAGAAVGFVSGMASVVVALVLSSTITARVAADGGDPRIDGPAAVKGVLVVGLVQVAVAAVGYLVAPGLQEGRGWVRVVLTLSGVVGVASVLAAATANTQPALTLLSAVGVLLVLVAVLLAHQPRTSAWFRSLRPSGVHR